MAVPGSPWACTGGAGRPGWQEWGCNDGVLSEASAKPTGWESTSPAGKRWPLAETGHLLRGWKWGDC